MQGETALVTLNFDVFVFATPPLVLVFRILRSVLYINRLGFGCQTPLLPTFLNFTFFIDKRRTMFPFPNLR